MIDLDELFEAEDEPATAKEARTARQKAKDSKPPSVGDDIDSTADTNRSQSRENQHQMNSEPESAMEPARKAREQTDEEFFDPQRWILIGPTSSGKTTLIGSFEQAVSAPARDHLELRLHARNEACQAVLSSALGRLLLPNKQIGATLGAEDLAFTLEVEPSHRTINVLMADAQGGAMFTENNTHIDSLDGESARATIDKLARTWKSSDCLLLLIPAERAGSDTPISMEISQGLSHLTRKMLVTPKHQPTHERRWWQRLLGQTASPTVPSPRLPFKRVLVLITKADLVAQNLLDDYHHWQVDQRDPNGYRVECPLPASLQDRKNLTARDVAEAMEPVASARRLLSEKVLNQLVKDVSIDCKVAVCFVSVTGFSRSGHPIANKAGQAVAPAGETMTREFRDKIVREWSPWGLRAALYFLATGDLIHGEPIAALNLAVIRQREH